MATIRELLVSIGVDAKSEPLIKFDSSLKQVKGSASSLIGIVGMLGAALGGLTVGNFIKESIQLAGAAQSAENSFTVMLGSVDKAKTTLEELRKFAEKTPFRMTEVRDLSKNLLAAGFSAEELIPTMRMLGDISSGVGKEKLPFIVGALRDVRNKTVLTGEEMRQFMNNAVPLREALAKTLKIDPKLLSDPAKLGITYKQVEEALKSLTMKGGKFFDLMNTDSKTWEGQISTLQDVFDSFKTSFGEGFIEVMLPALDDYNKSLDATGENHKKTFKEMGKDLGEYARNLVEKLQQNMELVKAALIGLGVIAGMIALLIVKAFVMATIAALPFIAIVFAIGAAFGGVAYGIYTIIQEAIASFDHFKREMTKTGEWWVSVWDKSINWVKSIFTGFFDWIYGLNKRFENLINPIVETIGGFFGKEMKIRATSEMMQFGMNALPKPAPAASPVATAAQNYNSNADNRQYNINVNANSVKNPEKFGYDFATGLLEGVE